MIEEVETVPLTGRRAVWDGTNLDEIRELAGDAVLGVQVDAVQLRMPDGRVHHVEQGWSVTRLSGVAEEFSLIISSEKALAEVLRVREPAGA